MCYLKNNWIFDKCDTLDISTDFSWFRKALCKKSFKLVIFPNRLLPDGPNTPTQHLLIWDLIFFLQNTILLHLSLILSIIFLKIHMFRLREHGRHRRHLPTIKKIYRHMQIYFFVLASIILYSPLLVYFTLRQHCVWLVSM